MSKKCPPGVFCIENYTLFLLFIIVIGLIIYSYVHFVIKYQSHNHYKSNLTPVSLVNTNLLPVSTRNDPMNDPYYPPEKYPGLYFPTNSSDIRGIPINIRTRGVPTEYSQVGILTRSQGNTNENLILPLMGRRAATSNDKWNYYTMASNGHMNTKLPISVKGKSCTNDYGCDEIYNNDVVYVEGYKETFNATVYENGEFRYIPTI
jgi:hypothetical protein